MRRRFLRRAIREALRRLIGREQTQSLRAPLSYVTEDGLLQLPRDVQERLGLLQGGGVIILDTAPGTVEVMSNETWCIRAFGEGGEE